MNQGLYCIICHSFLSLHCCLRMIPDSFLDEEHIILWLEMCTNTSLKSRSQYSTKWPSQGFQQILKDPNNCVSSVRGSRVHWVSAQKMTPEVMRSQVRPKLGGIRLLGQEDEFSECVQWSTLILLRFHQGEQAKIALTIYWNMSFCISWEYKTERVGEVTQESGFCEITLVFFDWSSTSHIKMFSVFFWMYWCQCCYGYFLHYDIRCSTQVYLAASHRNMLFYKLFIISSSLFLYFATVNQTYTLYT